MENSAGSKCRKLAHFMLFHSLTYYLNEARIAYFAFTIPHSNQAKSFSFKYYPFPSPATIPPTPSHLSNPLQQLTFYFRNICVLPFQILDRRYNTYISSINQEPTMETHHLSYFLVAMRKILARAPPKSKNITSSSSLCRPTPDSLFQVQQKVWAVKSQLVEMLEVKGTSGDGDSLTNIEINLLKMVISKLALLNREPLYLFEEGALTLYEDFCGLIKSCTQDKIREGVKELLKDIGEGLKTLLLQHFIYQQYLSRKQNTDHGSTDHHELSLETCPNSANQESQADSSLIAQIEKQVLSTPVHLLISKQVRDYQRKMSEAAEVCRICFNKVLLRNVEQHVKECQKRNIIRQNIEEKKSELMQLKVNLKQKCQEINMKDMMTQNDEAFKKIARVILNFDKADKYVNRRCSMVAGRSDRHITDIKKLIQEFLENHGEDQLLKKIDKAYREKTYLEKQINQIEMSNLHKGNQHDEKENSPAQSSVKLSNFSIKTKTTHEKDKEKQGKKTVKKQTEHKLSNNSIELSESEQSDNKIDQPQFTQRKLKRCQTKNFQVQVHEDYEPLESVRQYSSLQAIIQQNQNKEISLNNFEILKVLGQGAFGKVYLVRRKETRDIYALKIIKIPENNTQSSLESIKRQHEIFKKIAGEHLVKAPFSFSQQNCHVFILEYLPGGDLRKMLNQEVYFDEERAKAYLAEIVLAIEHLHVFNIIHRDLKPENLVFDKTGHLKLTDFGLSQFQMKEKLQKSRKQEIQKQTKKTRRRRQAILSNNKQKMKLIGTPDYIAPQIIFKTSLNNFSIDWWSLGVMAYQLMIGTRPFCAQTIQEVIDNITNFNIQWPQIGYQEGMISPQAKDFICQLLNKDFMHRLGAGGVQSIKDHSFFASINWDTIKSTKPVAIPKITNLRDCMQFKEDLGLKREIAQFIQKGEKKRTVDLQKFVRFDLLGTETIENFHKIHEQQKKKLRTLKSLQENFLMEDCDEDI